MGSIFGRDNGRRERKTYLAAASYTPDSANKEGNMGG